MKNPNIHYRYNNKNGVEIYGFGIWNQDSGQYIAPLDSETKRLSGCHSEFSQKPIGGLPLEEAKARAIELWGYALVSE